MTVFAPNLTNLMLSIAAAIAGDAGCTLGTDLFVGGSPAPGSSQFAVFNITSGSQPGELYRVPMLSAQLMAVAPSAGDAIDQANRIYESLHVTTGGAVGRAKSMWSVPAKRISSTGAIEADPNPALASGWGVRYINFHQSPGALGRDKDGLWRAAFNFDASFTNPY